MSFFLFITEIFILYHNAEGYSICHFQFNLDDPFQNLMYIYIFRLFQIFKISNL